MKILIIDNGTYHLRALEHRLAGHDVEVTRYGQFEPKAASSVDLIVLSGGHTPIIGHSRYYRRELELIRSSPVPIIGICLGHELIARAYKVRPRRLLRKVHGIRRVIVDQNLSAQLNKISVYEAHKYAIKEAPAGFSIMAISNYGVEVMSSSKLLRYGMQFHPEVVDPPNEGVKVFTLLMDLATNVVH